MPHIHQTEQTVSAFALTNAVLIALCVFLALLAWARAQNRNRRRFEQLCRNPAVGTWLDTNISANEAANIRAAAKHFGIGKVQAKQLIERHRSNCR